MPCTILVANETSTSIETIIYLLKRVAWMLAFTNINNIEECEKFNLFKLNKFIFGKFRFCARICVCWRGRAAAMCTRALCAFISCDSSDTQHKSRNVLFVLPLLGSAHERYNCVHNRVLSACAYSKRRALCFSPFLRITAGPHSSATEIMYRLIHCIHSFAAFHHFSISAFMFN